MGGFFRKLEKTIRKPAKMLLPIVGTVAGSMFGGPIGGMVGGSLGGALSSKRHPLDHALFGALLGAGNAAMGPGIGKSLGVDPTGLVGRGLNMGHPSIFGQLSSMIGPAAYAGTQVAQKMPANQFEQQVSNQQQQTGSNEKGFFDTFTNPGVLLPFMGKALEGTRVDDKVQAGFKKIFGESKREEQERAKQYALMHNPADAPRNIRPLHRQYIQPSFDYKPGIDPEHVHFSDVNPPLEYYKKGGVIGTHFKGNDGGQSDKILKKIPERSYILNATTLSLLGDGNTENGVKRWRELENKLLNSGWVRKYSQHYRKGGMVDAYVSDGEYEVSPEIVLTIGKGSFDKGTSAINRFTENLRKQKGLKEFLPPKSKPIETYMKLRGVRV